MNRHALCPSRVYTDQSINAKMAMLNFVSQVCYLYIIVFSKVVVIHHPVLKKEGVTALDISQRKTSSSDWDADRLRPLAQSVKRSCSQHANQVSMFHTPLFSMHLSEGKLSTAPLCS